jgi:hypothetical protein
MALFEFGKESVAGEVALIVEDDAWVTVGEDRTGASLPHPKPEGSRSC